MDKNPLVLGCHVSMKAPDYFLGSVREALEYGANALMVYTGPPQSSARTDLGRLKIVAARELMAQAGIAPRNVVVHAPYIINLASPDESKQRFGVDFLAGEIDRAAALGASYVVLHPGSSVNTTPSAAIRNLAKNLNSVLRRTKGVTVCLETMAGKGNEIGRDFSQLGEIVSLIRDQSRIGVCWDTCHLNDAGYDLSDPGLVLAEFERHLDPGKIKVVHLNDSLNALGARKDRHANLGKGTIGLDALVRLLRHPQFKNLPFILETPYVEGRPPYAAEIELVRKHYGQ